MKTIYSDRHHLHRPQHEFVDGRLVAVSEIPERADSIVQRIREHGLGPVITPVAHDLSAALRVHRADYLHFLEHAWQDWAALGRTHDILPYCYPVRGMGGVRPVNPDGLAGYYAMDGCAPITAGTWQAVRSSLDCALTALACIEKGSERAAFAACRPPGHHAGADYMGGYCYLNNAAIAAQRAIDRGAKRVAVLDIDYHHGNGTQQIFYERADVLFVSLHADPIHEYPYFLGHAAERGAGAGAGCNLNFPLPLGTAYDQWGLALDEGCRAIQAYTPDMLVVSLGVDTYLGDPITQFMLESKDYVRAGERIAACGVPTLFVMEGGYEVGELGTLVVNVLEGFEGRAR